VWAGGNEPRPPCSAVCRGAGRDEDEVDRTSPCLTPVAYEFAQPARHAVGDIARELNSQDRGAGGKSVDSLVKLEQAAGGECACEIDSRADPCANSMANGCGIRNDMVRRSR